MYSCNPGTTNLIPLVSKIRVRWRSLPPSPPSPFSCWTRSNHPTNARKDLVSMVRRGGSLLEDDSLGRRNWLYGPTQKSTKWRNVTHCLPFATCARSRRLSLSPTILPPYVVIIALHPYRFNLIAAAIFISAPPRDGGFPKKFYAEI